MPGLHFEVKLVKATGCMLRNPYRGHGNVLHSVIGVVSAKMSKCIRLKHSSQRIDEKNKLFTTKHAAQLRAVTHRLLTADCWYAAAVSRH